MKTFFKIITFSLSLLAISCASNDDENFNINTEKRGTKLGKFSEKSARRLIAGNYKMVESTSGVHLEQNIKLRFRVSGDFIESIGDPYCYVFKAGFRKIDLDPEVHKQVYSGEIGFYNMIVSKTGDPNSFGCKEYYDLFDNFIPYFYNFYAVVYGRDDPKLITRYSYNMETGVLTISSEDEETTKFVFKKIRY
ncbi:hypothetical protein [Tenacibaculum sp. nBUS_03]|uniref:hypothetical protein n=1 Tax=Tenacibaculum sp. nBUS_03 TaxID=3395320 RepID=UPI003EB88AB2